MNSIRHADISEVKITASALFTFFAPKFILLRFSGYFWIIMATYILTFMKHFLSFRTLATTDVEAYRRRTAPTSGSCTAKTSKDFLFIWSVEAIKLPKLQIKVLSSALKRLFPSSWHYLMWTTLNRIIFKRKITKLNHLLQISLIYRNS